MISSLYGLDIANVEDARNVIEETLRVKLAPHDSFYRGGPYYLYKAGDTELIVQRNYDLIDQAPAEDVDLPVLVFLDGADGAVELEERMRQIPTAKLLRRSNR